MTAKEPSPEVEMPLPISIPTEGRHSPDMLDDVFGSPPRSAEGGDFSSALDAHPSDMPRLRSQHYTSGYRDGYIDSKEANLQAGFDEGYSLGATIGLRVGQLLGVLEGIAEGSPDREAAQAMLALARTELATEGVFTPEYWASDGTWKFEVGARRGKPVEEDGDAVFADVAEAHPVLSKWRGVVEKEMLRWGVSWDAFAPGVAGPEHRNEGMGEAEGGERALGLGGVGDAPDESAATTGTKRKGKVAGKPKKTALDW